MTVQVEVPPVLTVAPFDVTRNVTVPSGFGIRVVARIPGARFMAEAPNGDLLVSQPSTGKVLRVVRGTSTANEFATGLKLGHDLVFHAIGATTWLYLGEANQISRAPYSSGDTTMQPRTVIVANLPDASLPELNGAYAHSLKNIALAGNTLYVSIASASNADPADLAATPKRGAIYVYNADGSGGRLYAQGLRNAEGLAIHPTTGELWAAVNHRDNILYPLHDGRFPFKALDPAYVNDNPPEPFTRVRDGGHYGWPFCNPSADAGTDSPPYLPDAETNADGAVFDCNAIDRVSKILPAHSAPLGMSFWTGANAPAQFRNAAVIGLHGCWNCTVPRGYKVVVLPAQGNGFGDPVDLISGFLTDPADKDSRWGRPVDAIPNRDGNLYVSDDFAGAIYELYRR